MRIDYKLLERYLRDRDSSENIEIIAKWFSNIEVEKELRDKSCQYWKDLPEEIDTDNYDEEMVLGNIYRRIKIEESKNSTSPSKAVRILY